MTVQELVRTQEKGQITIPAELRRKFGWKKGDVVAITETGDEILIVPREVAVSRALDEIGRILRNAEGLTSLQHVAAYHVPYAILLYERYLGRPYASHRDSVSELVGNVMEIAIEERLSGSRITFRKTKRAERIPGYTQAPDFFVPDEFNAAALIEAKITGDDGTARDKITRIIHLTEMRDERVRAGQTSFQVVAYIDGRGFGVRREDMRRLLLRTEGKIFTLATLDRLIPHTRLREFLPRNSAGA